MLEPLLQTTAKNKLFECQKKSQIIRVNSVTVVRRYLYFKYMRTRKQSGMMARRIDDPIYQLLRRVLGRTVLMHGRGLIMRIISFCNILFAPPLYTISLEKSASAYISYTAWALGLDVHRVASKCSLCIKSVHRVY